MSAYAQSQPTHSALHFPLSSPPLHIPPTLESLETPTSKGFTFGLVRHPRHSGDSQSSAGWRKDSSSSVEGWPFGTASRQSIKQDEHKFDQGLPRRSSIRARQPSNPSLLRRSPSMYTLSLEAEYLPELSRTNSASTCCSSSHGHTMTPPYSSWDSEIQVLSEEEEDAQQVSADDEVSVPAKVGRAQPTRRAQLSPPTSLKRPGLTRRDTPIPPKDLVHPIRQPSKSFTSSLTSAPSSTSSNPTSSAQPSSQQQPKRPPFKRRDTPHPMFDPDVQPSQNTAMPNFFSSSLRESLRHSALAHPIAGETTSYAYSPRMVPLSGFSPESVADDEFALDHDETFVLGSPEMVPARLSTRFSSVLDGKVWVSM